ncbi:MAG: hydantoinase/oxoprolinase family protein [Pseudomonadota bacterium]
MTEACTYGANGYRIGVDVGGTFTDLVLLHPRNQRLTHHKVPSTPDDPARAIATGIGELLAAEAVPASAVIYVGHGTTVATNMVIERRGARTALITTAGFRDVLEIARQTRPALYDYRQARPAPLAPRAWRYELPERVSADGKVMSAFDDDALATIIEQLRASGMEAVAVSFLHSYRFPGHEQRCLTRLREQLPDVYATASSDVSPEFREFERSSTVVVNAFVGPRMRRYMQRLGEGVAELGIPVAPFTVQSSGGVMSVTEVEAAPVRTCLSGPAAGVVSAAVLSDATGLANVMTFDVGGTSTDVSMIVDGAPAYTAERDVAGYPVRTPMVDVHVVGAGGGSIARVDAAGALKVGPQSAGASPGPIAYGRGGAAVTVTDANLVLGRLASEGLLGGRMAVDVAAARDGMQAQVGDLLEMNAEAAADGVIAVAVANIGRAIRAVATARGHDPADMTLVAYGGAGPLHATAVAREVQSRRVLVPPAPGTLCARGVLQSDPARDFVVSIVRGLNDGGWSAASDAFATLKGEAAGWFDAQSGPGPGRLRWSVDARYEGQSFEVPVPLNDPAVLSEGDFADALHAAHTGHYGYAIDNRDVIIVNCRARAEWAVEKAALERTDAGADVPPRAAEIGRRNVYVGVTAGWQSVPVYERGRLTSGMSVAGPAIVSEMTSTTWLAAADHATVDDFGNLVIAVGTFDMPDEGPGR